MWAGESDKYTNAVFKLTNRLAPCVVFMDEVDALFGERTSGGGGGTDVRRAMITEFMQAMDGLNSGKDKGVVRCHQ
ncbi:hypothetical protein E1B28_006182 [Marasmius oreades]|uniref:ATPase AAA-type core domain-containing protein n=1 Tax=Marasmius oreades TaxID=181124 RepID=A0A9P7UVC1_9AGAR|nr:uncharacterized protein E1B28_006182 [Marasmius oreades]KAG7095433.1 hypothetical protein E1B28_006182 [Marasmius oreades]